jgi:acyl-CoA thioester hydrolase
MDYTTEIRVRFRDLDPMQHVNNAVYATYLEQARANYYEDVVGVPLAEIDTVLAEIQVSYEQPIESVGSVVVVALEIDDVGRSSIHMTYEMRPADGGERYATASSVQVYFDPETGESEPIPDRYRERLS